MLHKEIRIFERANPHNACIVNLSHYSFSQLLDLFKIQFSICGRDDIERVSDPENGGDPSGQSNTSSPESM